jgi:hypothetical protein
LQKSSRKILLYITYGEDRGYYDGAIFSYLTFMNWVSENDPIETVMLTQKPEEFKDFPVTIMPINEQQKNDWSLNDKYHFRIKNRGLAFVMDSLNLTDQDKILFFDSDTYFHTNPINLFNLIQPDQALFYLNEGQIYKRKRFYVYIQYLEGKTISIGNENYRLSKESTMWGSLMVGIMPNMRSSLEWSDKLLLKLIDMVPVHTIEPFALAETLLRKYKIIEGKNFVSLYSTSRKKKHAIEVLSVFFDEIKNLTLKDKILLAQKVKIKRSALKVIKQRLFQIINYVKK